MGPVRAIRRVVGLVALGALLAPACAWNPDVARPVALNAAAQSSKIFAATAEKLTRAQSALLAALIRSPRSYDPYRAPAAARSRRNLVLSELVAQGKVTRELADAAKAEPVGVVTQPLQARYPAGHFVEEVKQLLLDNRAFGRTAAERQAALFTGGLRVYTTLDPARQSEAEQAVGRVLSQPATDPEGA